MPESWLAASLNDSHDSREPYRVTCGNDPSVLNTLDPDQKGLLLVHECFYLIAGSDTSVEVRRLMEAVLQPAASPAELADAIRAIGGDVTAAQDARAAQAAFDRFRQRCCGSAALIWRSTTDALHRDFDEVDRIAWDGGLTPTLRTIYLSLSTALSDAYFVLSEEMVVGKTDGWQSQIPRDHQPLKNMCSALSRPVAP